MSELEIPVKNIEQKLKEVTKRYGTLKKENIRLQTEVEKLNDHIFQKENELQQLRHQTALLKSGVQSWHPEQRKMFVKRIDTYLKEIDKCMALLNE